MSEIKDKNLLYINHSGELLIWLIVILIAVVIFFFNNILHKNSDYEYKIFMPDVDGLIVGSPVRTMGIEVGHVTEIEPIKDQVLVKFIIKDENIKIPQGTNVTVEFSGMAGSKSLELYLPDHNTYIDPNVPELTVSPPKRLSDAAGLLNEMFKEIGKIITITSQFSSKMSEIEFPESTGNPKAFLKYADEIIDKQQTRADDLGAKLNERWKFNNN